LKTHIFFITIFYFLDGGVQNNCPNTAPPANENANKNINITIKVPTILTSF